MTFWSHAPSPATFRRVRPQALVAYQLARYLGWPDVDNLAVAKHLAFYRWLVTTGRLEGDCHAAL